MLKQKNDAKYSQMALLICLIVPACKFMNMPIELYRQGGRDFWLGYALLFVADLVCFGFLIWAARLNGGNLNLKEILKKSVGVIVADIVLILMASFFMLKFILILLDIMELCSGTLVIKSNWLMFAALMLLAAYFVLKHGFNSIARLTQMLFVPLLLSIVFIIVLSVADCDFTNLFPILSNGMMPVFNTALYGSFIFGDILIFLLLFGDLTPQKRGDAQLLLGFGVGNILTVALSVVYISLFGELAGIGNIAIGKVSQFNVSSSVSGRLDWLLIAVWLNAIFLQLFTLAFAFNRCVKFVFNVKKDKFNYWIYGVFCLLVLIVPLILDTEDFFDKYVCGGWIKYVFFIVLYLLPLCMPLLSYIANKTKAQYNDAGTSNPNIAKNSGGKKRGGLKTV